MTNFVIRSPLMDGEPAAAGGTDPSPAPAFDVAALRNELLTEFRKDLNGAVKGLKTDFAKLMLPKAPDPAPSPDPAPTPDGKAVDPEKNALLLEIKKLRADSDARIQALEKTNEETRAEAESTKRGSALRDVLGKFEFMSPTAHSDAIELFTSKVQRSDDGSYIAGDLPLDKYIERELAGPKSYLIKGKEIGGANARPGKPGPAGKTWDLDRDLKPEIFSKYTPQEQGEIREFVKQVNGF